MLPINPINNFSTELCTYSEASTACVDHDGMKPTWAWGDAGSPLMWDYTHVGKLDIMSRPTVVLN